MQLSGIRPSVCPSVQFGRRTRLLRICCCGPGGQEISIDCGTASRRRLAAAAAPQHGAQQQMRGVPRCQLT